eukprot:jgi/Mesvir1/27624/Mv07356-RA.1
MDNVLMELQKEIPTTRCIRVEAEEMADAVETYCVKAVPSFLFFKEGKVVARLEGASPSTLIDLARKFSGNEPDLPIPHVHAHAHDASYLETLAQRSPVVLFMKGTPELPQCGFSAKTVAALLKYVCKIDAVNVLENEGVREGMKAFSKWPTFPQLYVKGKFVGGCDIVLEMEAKGELSKLFANL